MSSTTPPRQVVFDPTPGDPRHRYRGPAPAIRSWSAGKAFLGTSAYDEVRFVLSLWHPSGQRTIDLDRAYVELRACFDPEEEHWTKIAEIEPVVPPYAGSDSFDGWIVRRCWGSSSAFALFGSGFESAPACRSAPARISSRSEPVTKRSGLGPG